jgi:hypothetical protein
MCVTVTVTVTVSVRVGEDRRSLNPPFHLFIYLFKTILIGLNYLLSYFMSGQKSTQTSHISKMSKIWNWVRLDKFVINIKGRGTIPYR